MVSAHSVSLAYSFVRRSFGRFAWPQGWRWPHTTPPTVVSNSVIYSGIADCVLVAWLESWLHFRSVDSCALSVGQHTVPRSRLLVVAVFWLSNVSFRYIRVHYVRRDISCGNICPSSLAFSPLQILVQQRAELAHRAKQVKWCYWVEMSSSHYRLEVLFR